MPKALLDTDILSEYLKGHDQTVANHAASYARQHGGVPFAPSVGPVGQQRRLAAAGSAQHHQGRPIAHGMGVQAVDVLRTTDVDLAAAGRIGFVIGGGKSA
jgi:hypothetical protein